MDGSGFSFVMTQSLGEREGVLGIWLRFSDASTNRKKLEKD
jgi:hypothetical protein